MQPPHAFPSPDLSRKSNHSVELLATPSVAPLILPSGPLPSHQSCIYNDWRRTRHHGMSTDFPMLDALIMSPYLDVLALNRACKSYMANKDPGIIFVHVLQNVSKGVMVHIPAFHTRIPTSLWEGSTPTSRSDVRRWRRVDA